MSRMGNCMWCGTATQPRASNAGRGRFSEHDLRQLHVVHLGAGLSVRELARRVGERHGFQHADAAYDAIRGGWKRLGLKAADREVSLRRAKAARRLPGSPGTENRAAHMRWWRAQQREKAAA